MSLALLNRTPPERLTDAQGRPYFLWDNPAMTLVDFVRALRDAGKKDGGFSPLMLSWVLRSTDYKKIAQLAGLTASESEELARFRDHLVDELARASTP